MVLLCNVVMKSHVVSYMSNMQIFSLSNRETTDRKDLRELLERMVLE